MSSTTVPENEEGFAAHKAMWDWYTKFMTRSIIAVIVSVVIVGFLTGVL